MNKLLEIRNLSIRFCLQHQIVQAVERVDLDIFEDEILALVGESGSGKTMTALSVTGILPQSAKITGGEVIFQGRDLLKTAERDLEAIRGKEISYIFQEAQASLNPVLPIGRQIQESIILHHQAKDKKEALNIAGHLLELVRLPHPQRILRSYPHQLSGGMNQRVMIALGLSCRPKLLIADEPTSSLDVTVEAQIIRMLLELKEKLRFSILFITHNLALAERFASRVAIMFKGKIVEEGLTKDIFSAPQHPHTQELINSIIRLNR
ncbi:MAG: ABC transporter ATP-binding protein [Candidatus Omnitrophota bacterium]